MNQANRIAIVLIEFRRTEISTDDPDTMWRAQAEKFLREMDLVKREEFEAVKDMARLAREENEALKARLAVLEGKLGVSPSAPNTGT